VMVKFPASIWGGVAEESCGTGLSNVVTVEAVRPLWFGTAAAIVTAFGDGSVAGAVYVAVKGPVLVMVPTIAFPFAMSFTVQVTVGFVSFATVAVKACVPLARTEGPEGEMATRSVPVDELPVRPAQLAANPATMQTKSVSPKRRTAASPVLIRKILAETLSTPSPLESFGILKARINRSFRAGWQGSNAKVCIKLARGPDCVACPRVLQMSFGRSPKNPRR
jgi:hypothetical protein